MLLRDVVDTSGTVAATRSRTAKIAAIAERLAQADVSELPVVTAYLGGTVLQRRTGVGWRGLSGLPEPATEPTLTPLAVDQTLARLAAMSGPGSQETRTAGVRDLFGRATADEQRWLRGVLTGNVRQGALDALVQEATRGGLGRRAHRRTPRRHARGRHSADRGRGDDRRCRRPRRGRARGGPAGAADAGVDRTRRGRGDGQGGRWRAGGGRREARRHPDPGPSRRRRAS